MPVHLSGEPFNASTLERRELECQYILIKRAQTLREGRLPDIFSNEELGGRGFLFPWAFHLETHRKGTPPRGGGGGSQFERGTLSKMPVHLKGETLNTSTFERRALQCLHI